MDLKEFSDGLAMEKRDGDRTKMIPQVRPLHPLPRGLPEVFLCWCPRILFKPLPAPLHTALTVQSLCITCLNYNCYLGPSS